MTRESHHDIPSKLTLRKRRVIMKVSRVTQNIRIWCATGITRRGTLELIVGLIRRNNEMLMSLNWLKGMKISVMFYLLQIDRSVIKIDRLLTLNVHIILVLVERCSSYTLRFKGERSSRRILL